MIRRALGVLLLYLALVTGGRSYALDGKDFDSEAVQNLNKALAICHDARHGVWYGEIFKCEKLCKTVGQGFRNMYPTQYTQPLIDWVCTPDNPAIS